MDWRLFLLRGGLSLILVAEMLTGAGVVAAEDVEDPVSRLEREVAELKAAMEELRAEGMAEPRGSV